MKNNKKIKNKNPSKIKMQNIPPYKWTLKKIIVEAKTEATH